MQTPTPRPDREVWACDRCKRVHKRGEECPPNERTASDPAPRRIREIRHVGPDDLAVSCWCEATIVHVPRQLVLDGRTASCGQPDCNEEAAA